MNHQQFLDAVAAAPDNVSLRLQYADWLEEHGNPLCHEWRKGVVQIRMETNSPSIHYPTGGSGFGDFAGDGSGDGNGANDGDGFGAGYSFSTGSGDGIGPYSHSVEYLLQMARLLADRGGQR